MNAMRTRQVGTLLGLALVATALTGCGAKDDGPANATPITAPVKLIGGACVGSQKLQPGWHLYSRKLDIDDPGTSVALILLRAPTPRTAMPFAGAKPRAGLIEVQARDLFHYPDFSGSRSYEDVIRDTARARSGAGTPETYGPLTLSKYPAPGGDEYFIANDPGQSLITCTPPGGDGESACRVTATTADGKFKLTTAFGYGDRARFKAMEAQGEAALAAAIVPCP